MADLFLAVLHLQGCSICGGESDVDCYRNLGRTTDVEKANDERAAQDIVTVRQLLHLNPFKWNNNWDFLQLRGSRGGERLWHCFNFSFNLVLCLKTLLTSTKFCWARITEYIPVPKADMISHILRHCYFSLDNCKIFTDLGQFSLVTTIRSVRTYYISN